MLTIDYDAKPSDPTPRQVYRRLKRLTGKEPDKVKISSSGSGLHYIYHNHEENIEEIREKLDDPGRLAIDKEKKKAPKQILWNAKIIQGTEFKATEINPDHLEYIRLVPWTMKYRGLENE